MVNQEICIGCGACIAECPDTFKFNDSGKSEAISQDNAACAKKAAEICPVQAISAE